MLNLLKNHPFPVEAFFEFSLVLTYAVAPEELINRIPPCLTLDTHEEKHAFVAVAMVKTRNLRPKGFPTFMGNDFFLTGYRIFVRYTTSQGKRLRGLYILGSETDKTKMAFLGNIFTHYNYTQTDMQLTRNHSTFRVQSMKSDLDVEVVAADDTVALPTHSPFRDWKQARRFAGPLPFTFTFNPHTNEVLIIEGVRENWTPRPVEVVRSHAGFVEKMELKDPVLANAFIIENIPYHWKKGKVDLWKG